jgi:hypothetical protein
MTKKDEQADGVSNSDQKPSRQLSIVPEPAADELTGRATGTDDDLAALFASESGNHLADGFSGGSDDDAGVATTDDESPLEVPEVEPELE